MGAEVVVCPTNVEADDQGLIISLKRILEETKNSWYVNQYDNPSNTTARTNQQVEKYRGRLMERLFTTWCRNRWDNFRYWKILKSDLVLKYGY